MAWISLFYTLLCLHSASCWLQPIRANVPGGKTKPAGSAPWNAEQKKEEGNEGKEARGPH